MNHHVSARLGGAVVALAATLGVLGGTVPNSAVPSSAVASGTGAGLSPVVRATATSGKTDKLHDPRANLAAAPDFHDVCALDGPRNPTCVEQALTAINHAHAAEGVRKMVLPDDFSHLSIVRQTFVITDLERVDRGLRPFAGLTAKLNASAHHAAVVRDDPTLIGALLNLLGIREYASIWAGDFGPLASDYDWMYNDGYSASGSVNLDCKKPGATGCWGHRHAILGAFTGLATLIAGGGTSTPAGSSIAEILAGTSGKRPALTYTWRDALDHGANGHQISA